MMRMNPHLAGLSCLRCGHRLPPGDYPEGCPVCLAQGHPSSLRCEYAHHDDGGMPMPVLDALSLGEGATPCLPAQSLAREHGLAQVWLKCESGNPTGTHKDRMAAQLVSRAVLAGAPGMAAASSGNGGVALAAYCAAAGLPIEIAVAPSCPDPQRDAMLRFGARLTPFDDSLARWHHVARLCRETGAFAGTNYLDPPVGTHAYGVEGYKPLAQELLDACGLPTDIVVPTARGDLMWGMLLGWQYLLASGRIDRLPRLHAVEPYARLSQVLEGGDVRAHRDGSTSQYSIGGVTSTLQAVHAVRDTGGQALDVSDADARAAHRQLAAMGLQTELSSSAALAALRQLSSRGVVDGESRVVLLLTSDGRRGI